MITVYTILFIAGFTFVIQRLAKYGLKRIHAREEKKGLSKNPYIAAHLLKEKNDEYHAEYMRWYEKNGTHQPIPKIVAKEDAAVEKKIKNLFR